MNQKIADKGLCSVSGRASLLALLTAVASLGLAQNDIISLQTPAPGGGIMRWSKLWVDPSGQGNDLDGDAICYADFVLRGPATLRQLEWWGKVVPDQGFQLEFWRQDPGTIAYQPLAVFRSQGALPEAEFVVTSFTSEPDPSGTVHYSVNLPTPVVLAANTPANPRWFVAVIGLTSIPYWEWTWAQGLGGSNATFQFIRGYAGGGDRFFLLGDGRAMKIVGDLTGLHGQVTLDRFIASPEGQKVTIDLLSGTTVVESQTVTLDALGEFGMGTTRTGNFGVAIRGSHWLRKIVGTVSIPGTVSALLVNGDITRDNRVDSDDFDVLVAAFGSGSAAADLDGSGLVDSDDFDILVESFGLVGD